MSEDNPIRIYVSHVWQSDDDYQRVFEYLESARNFFYKNCSDPDSDPGPDKEAMRRSLRSQMEKSEVVILLSSLFATDPSWMQFQISAALALNKPIIAVHPFGGEGVPDELGSKADEIVGWDPRGMEDAIRRCARHEETQRWDTIEWDPD